MDERNELSLAVSSKDDLGNLNVRISGTGDNCPVVDGKNVCNSEYAFQGNLFTSPRDIPVTLANTNVGSSIIDVKICQNVRCTERQIAIPVVAGAMTNVAVITPTDRVLYNSQVPFIIMGYDAYGNPVEQTTTTYKLSTNAGQIISDGNTSAELELQHFGPLQNYFADLSNLPS